MYRKSHHPIYLDFAKMTIEQMRLYGYDTYKKEIDYMYASREIQIYYKDKKSD